MPIDYYEAATKRSLAGVLDEAWDHYRDESLKKEERKNALNFLINILDIRTLSLDENSINEPLTRLMNERELKKRDNPEYIPILDSARYHFETKAGVLNATSHSYHSNDRSIQRAFDNQELLDVNGDAKLEDNYEKTKTYLDSNTRAEFRVDIYDGLFHQSGKVFDSSKEIAHFKPGYVAFTLNTNGELSVFSHLNTEEDEKGRCLAHSSMNAGAPVLAAGEMEIKNGQLISINTHSGHYHPSLFSLAHFLEYLSARGIDISKTQILLQNRPDPQSQLKSTSTRVQGDSKEWYAVPATDLIYTVRNVVESNLHSINDYLNSFKTKFACSSMTKEKVALAKQFKDEMRYVMGVMKATSSLYEMRTSLIMIDSIITRYSDANATIHHGSPGRLGRKFEEMKKNVGDVKNKPNHINEIARVRGMKRSH